MYFSYMIYIYNVIVISRFAFVNTSNGDTQFSNKCIDVVSEIHPKKQSYSYLTL